MHSTFKLGSLRGQAQAPIHEPIVNILRIFELARPEFNVNQRESGISTKREACGLLFKLLHEIRRASGIEIGMITVSC